MFSDFETSLLADGESTSRVGAKIVVDVAIEEESSASTTAPPCFPVAPMTRTLRLEAIGGDSDDVWGSSKCVRVLWMQLDLQWVRANVDL